MNIESIKERLKKAESLSFDILEQEKNLIAYLDLSAKAKEVEGMNALLVCQIFLKGLEWYNHKELNETLEEYCYAVLNKLVTDERLKTDIAKLSAIIDYIEFKKTKQLKC